MTTDPSTVDFHMDYCRGSLDESAFLAAEETRTWEKYRQRGERLDNAIHSQSHRVQQQNTRRPVTCASQQDGVNVTHKSTTVNNTRIRQGGNELSVA
jgi:hypothetical protein